MTQTSSIGRRRPNYDEKEFLRRIQRKKNNTEQGHKPSMVAEPLLEYGNWRIPTANKKGYVPSTNIIFRIRAKI